MTADTRWRPLAIILWIVLLIFLAFFLDGCASLDYDWQRTKPPSPKPWHTIIVQDVDKACRAAGAALTTDRILGCATWRADGCTIYLTPNAPTWIIEHERKHCEGWIHP
mgnify:CR=1 FL=1